ncbi:MAG: hypothetical protein QOE70_1800 [Chthoniobacter sp.]|jgi:hypothetical protein|nr:hypothetical protein [Chthoniobacter sp.]
MKSPLLLLLAVTAGVFAADEKPSAGPANFSGIYPHLAMFNNEGECGTGAVVPWAERLWVITYGPHLPYGSSDKLYEIDNALTQTVRPESIGGTPANRMIHRESGQLFIGPYAIDDKRGVRVIPWKQMPGRLTGNARHLTDPAGKIHYATMEEGLYEVDVRTLEVTGLIKDGNNPKAGQTDQAHPATIDSKLPGYHGKGLYSGQGRVVYANNGDHDPRVTTDPTVPSGALGEWRKPGDDWQLVRRNQFTEVTGPGGIFGNEKPETDPIWSIGWDYRSLILMLLDGGKWHAFRLPKASHCYDGAHGWNTEWPRIRDIGESDLLMTMHGMFWHFPKTFSVANTAGIAPRSTYLKVVGDFCRWKDRLVLGCDDTAKSEFLNKRGVKGALAAPGQSQSNLWFIAPAQLDQFGPPSATGAVWMNDAVKANEPSDAFLFAGFPRRSLHLAHEHGEAVTFTLETDAGDGAWLKLRDITVPARGYQWVEFKPEERGAWIRLRADRDVAGATADFHFSAPDERAPEAAPLFAGVAAADAQDYSGGLIRARGEDKRTLAFAATTVRGGKVAEEGYYELDASLALRPVDDPKAHEFLKANAAVPRGVISVDAASVLVVDDGGRHWRLPRGDAALETEGALPLRVDREVCTERDLLHAYGTFYEVPAENAGGFIKMRPIASPNRRITDYCSWRGLLVLSGLAAEAPAGNRHIVRSDDGKCGLWLGAVDDLWQFGKPAGAGGPWKDTAVEAGPPSDPFLMTNYERKSLTLSHTAEGAVTFIVEVDFLANGTWREYGRFTVEPGKTFTHDFPPGYSARWVRLKSDQAATVSATFRYQ